MMQLAAQSLFDLIVGTKPAGVDYNEGIRCITHVSNTAHKRLQTHIVLATARG
jgi:hypothetical protein